MRLRTPLLTLAALALAVCAAARAQDEPQNDQRIIDDFATQRGMSFTSPAKPKPARPTPTPARPGVAKNRRPAAGKPAGGASAGKPAAGKGGAASKSDGGVAEPQAAPQAGGADGDGAKFLQAGARPLGLGYTLFLKQDGVLSYADPSQEFRTGDKVAIAFESNADGYLYIFNSSGDAKTPDMIFPSAALDDGANALRASTYETFPSDANDGFIFTNPPGTEHLFVVFSRKPLAGVLTGPALVKFCRGKGNDCAWPVPAALWTRIFDGAKGRRAIKNSQLAAGEPPADALATVQRGIRVDKSAPKPAFLRVNDTPDADTLVTEIVLTHK